MAHLLRLTLALLVFAVSVLMPGTARAAIYGGSSTPQSQAYAECMAHEWPCSGPYPASAGPSGTPFYQAVNPSDNNQYHVWAFGTLVCADPELPPQPGGGCGAPAPTEEECMARNIPPEGDTDGRGVADRLYLEGTAPSNYCWAQCNINVSPPHGEKSGINPATGEPATWTVHEQMYGPPPGGGSVVCDNSVTPNQDGNPENSMEDPSTNPPEDPGQWSCDYENGTCTDPEGNPNFCTFTGDPPVRSACVPASGDADGDGIPNDTDSAPSDPSNGEDTTSDESDNTSTGGGSCLSPPQSSGEPITAQIAFQTWATRCAVEALPGKLNISGTGTYDAAMAASAASTASSSSSTAANTAAANSKLDGIKTGTDNLIGANSFGDVEAGIPGEGVGPEDAFGDPTSDTGISDGFDDSGFLSAPRECPDLPTLEINGGEIDLDAKFENFCTFMEIGGMFVYLFGALASIKIYSKVFS